MTKRYFECVNEDSNKFWEVTHVDKKVDILFGKIGTKGQSIQKNFSDPTEASAYVENVVGEKIKKGYKEKIG